MKNPEVILRNRNQIRNIFLLKKQSNKIIYDPKIHQKVKPKLLPNLTNRLIKLVEEIEEIERIDREILQSNRKRSQNDTTFIELEYLRDKIFCLSFFTPATKKLTSEILKLLKDNKKKFLKTHLTPKRKIKLNAVNKLFSTFYKLLR